MCSHMRHFSQFLSPDDFCVHFTDVRVGEELTFDYGEQYWYSRNIAPAGSWRALFFFCLGGLGEPVHFCFALLDEA